MSPGRKCKRTPWLDFCISSSCVVEQSNKALQTIRLFNILLFFWLVLVSNVGALDTGLAKYDFISLY